MAGSMSSMPGGRRCRFQADEEDLYNSEEEAQIGYALKENRAVAAPLSDGNAETVDPIDSPDSLVEKPGLGTSGTDEGSPNKTRDEGSV